MEEEQEIVGKIQGMEKQRDKFLADIANVVNRDVETLTCFVVIVSRRNHHERYQAIVRLYMHSLNNWLFAAQMEKQRDKFLADIANVVNRDVETLKLIDLIQMLESWHFLK